MSAGSRARFTELVRGDLPDLAEACLLVGAEVEPDLDVAAGLARLDDLAAQARPLVPGHGDARAAADGLRQALGVHAGFGGRPEDYADLRSSLLHEVLRRRRGLPLLLSVVWVEVARRLGVPAEPVGLPGHVVVRLGGDPHGDGSGEGSGSGSGDGSGGVHVDPYGGGTLLDDAALDRMVRAATGRGLRPADLAPTPPPELLLRLLTNVRAWSARPDVALEATRTRLWAVELSLLLPRHPVALRRERGQLRVRLGDHRGGAAELSDYAELVAQVDEAEAEQVRREARQALAQLN